MAVLVTGAAGFIGSHLCERLLADGRSVIGLDNFDDHYDPQIKRANLAVASEQAGFTLVEGDICDQTCVDALLGRGDVSLIVHLAARPGVRPSIVDPFLYEKNNVQGTLMLLEGCRRHGLGSIVIASSSSVYGASTDVPFVEHASTDQPLSPYAASKKATEVLAYTYHELFDLDVTLLRFFTVYGPRQRPDMAIHKFSQLIERDQPITLFGDGSSARDYTYIDDIVDGVVRACEGVGGFRIYNLGGERITTLQELVRMLYERLGRTPRLEYLPDQPGDMRITFADVTRARDELGYVPQVSIEEGLDRFVSWFTSG